MNRERDEQLKAKAYEESRFNASAGLRADTNYQRNHLQNELEQYQIEIDSHRNHSERLQIEIRKIELQKRRIQERLNSIN